MTIVAMSRLVSPFITLIFACVFIGENTNLFQLVIIIATVFGATLVIYGEDYEASQKSAGVDLIPVYAYVLLGLGPIG